MPDYITTSRAAKILDVSEAAVRQMERRGALPAEIRSESGTRFFNREVVERIAAERAARRKATVTA